MNMDYRTQVEFLELIICHERKAAFKDLYIKSRKILNDLLILEIARYTCRYTCTSQLKYLKLHCQCLKLRYKWKRIYSLITDIQTEEILDIYNGHDL